MTTIAILLAAGSGTRFNSKTPKQYLPIHGKPIIFYSLNTFLNNDNIDYVLPVINNQHAELFTAAINSNQIASHSKLLPFVTGGDERYLSVLNALKFLEANYTPKRVLIHDCARPFISNSIINQVIANITDDSGVIPVIKINDSLKTLENKLITNIVDRNTTYSAQTPQGFDFNTILNAYINHISPETDDSEIYRKSGYKVFTVSGNNLNNKITTKEDYLQMEQLTCKTIYKIGQGFDVHKLAQNRDLYLGGIKIPHSLGLLGHSDADVVLHALVDAILGALGKGDIGIHFPPTDAKWKDANSNLFLEYCKQLLNENNAAISNIDLTIICEEPKITPHSNKMKENIANILQINENLINIKATTSETLGFTGRKEGIASLAVVSLVINNIIDI
ncbi:2-C-methyl-D-erythritol 2,4-cyclodiphosphate synthase [Rickettsiales bacterium LUAb2]